MKQLAFVVAALAVVSACKKKTEKAPEPGPGSAPSAGAPSDAEPAVDAAPAAWDGKSPLTIKGSFATPESVLYDADGDVYLVSNINGKPTDTDDNGYIAKVSPEGKVIEPKWIDGAKENVHLDAPKGMTISGGTLFVADITVVRQFDAKTGEPKPDIKIPGTTFLNDIAAAPDGGVYVTDTGVDASFKPTGADAVYQIDKAGKVKPLIKNKNLGNPNGIAVGDKGTLWVATFGTGQVYSLDAKGKQGKPEGPPKGQLDGIVALDGGEVLVSSWEGSAVYRGKPTAGGAPAPAGKPAKADKPAKGSAGSAGSAAGPAAEGGAESAWKTVVENVQSPADIGWDSKRKRILIPSFQGDAVVIHPLAE